MGKKGAKFSNLFGHIKICKFGQKSCEIGPKSAWLGSKDINKKKGCELAERCTIFDPVTEKLITDENEILATTLKYNIGVLTKKQSSRTGLTRS